MGYHFKELLTCTFRLDNIFSTINKEYQIKYLPYKRLHIQDLSDSHYLK